MNRAHARLQAYRVQWVIKTVANLRIAVRKKSWEFIPVHPHLPVHHCVPPGAIFDWRDVMVVFF